VVMADAAPAGRHYEAWGRHGQTTRFLAATATDRMNLPYEGLDSVDVRLADDRGWWQSVATIQLE
ncbi:MAG TPA: hypothetical protein VHN99_04090, partial [Deinococcales bacterium]|nr:hypothetical protein [Deinococcales bacterium]